MKKFWKVLGQILVYVVYALVVVNIIGIIRWTFKALFCRSN